MVRFNWQHVAALVLLLVGPIAANAQHGSGGWMVDKSHTSVNFDVNHFFSTVTGRFNQFNGDIQFDPNNLAGSKVSFSIDVASVDTDDAKRDEHLKSGDFFDAAKYPKMTFTSTRIEKKGKNEYVAHGKLTIRDKTRDIALPFQVTGEMEHPMMKGTMILGLACSTTLNRSDFGVGTGNWAATMVVGDEVDVNIHMELNRMKS